MRRRNTVRFAAMATAFATLLGLFGNGCSPSDSAIQKARLSEGCTLNTDCNAPLVCAFERCHVQCQSTRDCPSPAQCVATDKPYRVCELEGDRKSCSTTSDCAAPHVCAVDGVCRAECVVPRDCADGQVCSFGTCAETSELLSGQLRVTTPGAAEGRACAYNSDCPESLRCVAGACRYECRSEIDCSLGSRCEDGICRTSSGAASEGGACVYNGDCALPFVCTNGRCQRECRVDRDCALGETCEPVSSRCLRAAPASPEVDAGVDAASADAGPDAALEDAPSGDDARAMDGGDGSTDATIGAESGSSAPDGSVDAAGDTSSASDALVGDSGGPGNDAGSDGGTVTTPCANGVRDGDESDVDCGGSTCLPCSAGSGCSTFRDCLSSACTQNVCQTPTCSDGIKNGAESGVDCGGPTCGRCGLGAACNTGTDCLSGRCYLRQCAVPSCDDGIRDGSETDVDCGGGSCPRCDSLKGCSVASDCTSGSCGAGLCQSPTCFDAQKNGGETDVDCGGTSCAPCAVGKTCARAADCTSSVCTQLACTAPRCNDGVKNGAETATDCGGGTCTACGVGQNCSISGDCTSALCLGGACRATARLIVQRTGGGSGRVTSVPGGIDCGATCTAIVPVGTAVTLSPSVQVDSRFVGFSGGGCGGAGSCTLTMNADTTVTATFVSTTAGSVVHAFGLPSIYDANYKWVLLNGLAFAPNGDYALGTLADPVGTYDVGLGALRPTREEAYFTRFRSDGVALWTQRVSGPMGGGAARTDPRAITFGPTGDVFVLAQGPSPIEVAGAPQPCNVGGGAGEGMAIARFDGATGAPVWSVCRAAVSQISPRAIATMSDGNLVAVGFAQGDVDLGTGRLTANDSPRPFAMKVAALSGATTWVDRPTMVGSVSAIAQMVVADAAGGFVVGGSWLSVATGTMTFGTKSVSNAGHGVDFFVVRYDATGGVAWVKSFGGPQWDSIGGLAFDAAGDVTAVATFTDILNLGAGFAPLHSVGGHDLAVIKLRGSDGTPLSAWRYGGTGAEFVGIDGNAEGFSPSAYTGTSGSNSAFFLPGGDLVIGGVRGGNSTFGNFYLNDASWQIYMVRIRPDGSVAHAREYGGTATNEFPATFALSPQGLLGFTAMNQYGTSSVWGPFSVPSSLSRYSQSLVLVQP